MIFKKKNSYRYTFNRTNDKQLIVYRPMMMIRLFRIYMQYIKVIHPCPWLRPSRRTCSAYIDQHMTLSYLKNTQMFENNIHHLSRVHLCFEFLYKINHETTHCCIIRTVNTFARHIVIFCYTSLNSAKDKYGPMVTTSGIHTSSFSATVFPKEQAFVVIVNFKFSSELSNLKQPD